MQQNRSSGFFGAKPDSLLDAGLAEPAGQPENSCQCSHISLVVLMKFSEGSARGFGLCTAMVPHGGSERLPLLVGPRWRHRLLLEKAVRRFLPRFAGALQAQSAKSRGGTENATHTRVIEDRGRVCAPQGI